MARVFHRSLAWGTRHDLGARCGSLYRGHPDRIYWFLINGDLYSQWNAVQAKDGLNALGLGWVNLPNAGQMFGMHVVVLPLTLTLIIGAHITRVRLKSVVPPYPENVSTPVKEDTP